MYDVAADRFIAAATSEKWLGIQCSSCYAIKTMFQTGGHPILVDIAEFQRKVDGKFAVEARTRWRDDDLR